jgi:predicted hydrocarbon binding protein
VQQATLNNNKICEVKVVKPDILSSLILERLALLRVASNPADPVITDVGRRIGSNLYTVYLNLDEYKQIHALPSA